MLARGEPPIQSFPLLSCIAYRFASDNRFRDKQLLAVFGCGLYKKKFTECLLAAHQLSDRIVLVVSSHFKSAPVNLMRQTLEQAESLNRKLCSSEEGVPSTSDVSVSGGIKAALTLLQTQLIGPEGAIGWVIVVCGSLFVAAEGRAFLASLIPFPSHDWLYHADDHKCFAYK